MISEEKALRGKRILFIAPKFEPLYSQIIEELKKQGAHVEWIPNKVLYLDTNRKKDKLKYVRIFINIIYNQKFHYIKTNYYSKIKLQWDYLFVINGNIITKKFINYIKENNPDIETILYLWDSCNYYKFNNNFKFFNKIFTFDPQDAKKFKINYLPLFWTKNDFYGKENDKILFDISFIGKLHSDRYYIISKIKELCQKLDLSYFFKIIVPNETLNFKDKIYYYKDKILHKNTLHIMRYDFIKKKFDDEILDSLNINDDDFKKTISQSKCILDIELPNQSGLTIRTIQSLAQKKKILTTNDRISKDPIFKSCQNIKFIKRKNINIDKNFINSPYVEDNIYKYIIKELSISNWVKTIFI